MANKFIFKPNKIEELKDSYDVVIVGSGGAGLTSAIQAYELGLSPVILEKMDKIGGNTNRASSGMNAAETFVQLNHHIVDSFQEFYDETFIGGGKQNNPELLKFFTEHGALAIDWLDQHGLKLDDLTITGGMKTMRTHRPSSLMPIGGYLVTELLKYVEKYQIPLFDNVKVTDILSDNGQINGIKAESDREIEIKTSAVILATGGFGAGKDLLAQYRSDLLNLRTTNQPGATGDGIKLAQKLGAQLVDMEQVQVHPTVQQDTPHAYLIGEAVRGEGAILVNNDGTRFVNELDTRKNVTQAIDGLGGTGAYLIFDTDIRKRVKAIEFYDHVGLVKTGQTLTDLATEIKVDANNLEETVSKWNQAVKSQRDSEFNRTTGMERDISDGPFFAIHIAPAVHYTMGGLKINDKTQVLNTDNKVINGLFAAGEIAGGLHGNNRIGGNSIAETVVFGRQAGQQVYKYLH
ncbi:flavocytochrome c [Companilactobacillus pabuli]|jgi:fumarate reductase flavoprotein subunit|uniref:Flavocytochrome c n=1 Tax=Companilactobacillus pabuli TaxID=2714036 RepID=A0A7L7L0G0_9LACO|nr:flavocytochrome c [Companilactobacillus pabuli]AKP02424.1 cytochrome C [Companilactobacillus farciminis]AKS50722.1 cytochrome C [Companilactobacillus farciminis]MDG5113836.1 flavocytochrome c [Companilactobacillus pabuli]QMT84598.1 flavocytochrome c [Companilactobacillus pabuli]GAQ00738.1 cytochrome C [Companilactobacillus farciminis]